MSIPEMDVGVGLGFFKFPSVWRVQSLRDKAGTETGRETETGTGKGTDHLILPALRSPQPTAAPLPLGNSINTQLET